MLNPSKKEFDNFLDNYEPTLVEIPLESVLNSDELKKIPIMKGPMDNIEVEGKNKSVVCRPQKFKSLSKLQDFLSKGRMNDIPVCFALWKVVECYPSKGQIAFGYDPKIPYGIMAWFAMWVKNN
jgi:hypothetical protein